METNGLLPKHKRGQQLQNAERMVLISKLVDELCAGYMTTHALSKKLRIPKQTIETYRVVADKIIGEQKFDRNVIRNLQLKRTYTIIESLMEDLKGCKEIKDRTLIYNQIYKFSSHLALITGLNVETHVSIDPTKLVIIRANQNRKKTRIVESRAEESETVSA